MFYDRVVNRVIWLFLVFIGWIYMKGIFYFIFKDSGKLGYFSVGWVFLVRVGIGGI